MEKIKQLLPLVKDRLITLKDFDDSTSYFFQKPEINQNLFETIKLNTKSILDHAIGILADNWNGKVLEDKARVYCKENNIKVGEYFMVLRLAVTGRTATPPLWEVMEFLGKDETLERLENA